MKKKIRIFSLMMTIVILLTSTPVFVFADEDYSAYNYLRNAGVPESLLNTLCADEINDMYTDFYEKNLVYNGTTTVYYNESGISTLGTIPSSDMTLTITTATVSRYDSNLQKHVLKELQVFVHYVWSPQRPSVRRKDGITVNWDSSLFTCKSESFDSYDYAYLNSQTKWITYTNFKNPALAEQGGLGYFADISCYDTILLSPPHQVKGSCRFSLLPRDTMYTTSATNTGLSPSVTSINVIYTHDKNPVPFPVSFSYAGFSVTADFSGYNDSVAAIANYSFFK